MTDNARERQIPNEINQNRSQSESQNQNYSQSESYSQSQSRQNQTQDQNQNVRTMPQENLRQEGAKHSLFFIFHAPQNNVS